MLTRKAYWEGYLTSTSDLRMFLSGVKEILILRQKIIPRLNASIPKAKVRVSNGLDGGNKRSVSVIATCLNEAENIEPWLFALLGQSSTPNEVILSDGGSTDNTLQLANKWKQDHQKLNFKIISSPGANIAKGRNEAVKVSSSEILLFSDVGSLPGKEWVRELALPFQSYPEATVSLGISEVKSDSEIGRGIGKLIIQDRLEIDPEQFLASGRSIGVTRKAFDQAGGFPEELTFAGEDTLFNIRLRERVQTGFYFSPNAIASWIPPKTFKANWKMLFRYAKGDAEAGLFYRDYLTRITELNAIVFGALLSAYSLYYALLRGQYGVLFITIVAGYFALSPLLAYRDKLKDFSYKQQLIAPFAMISAQAFGFITGLISSKK